MAFQDFELIEGKEFFVRCKTCGKELPTGVIGLGEHWVNCTGKYFYAAVMENAKEGNKLTLDKVEELKKKHLNQ